VIGRPSWRTRGGQAQGDRARSARQAAAQHPGYDARVTPFARGLHELGSRCYAYLQPDGSWGWSNAGLVVGDGASLLVDTLFDLKLTAAMLDAMAPVRATAPISTVVNTHANGDHCYGNQLVQGAEIVASTATAGEMGDVSPAMLAGLSAAPGELGEMFRGFFGAFDFTGIELTLPTRTFDGRLDLDVGGRTVSLIEVGPAHTRGDTLVHVPDARTVYTGDILFIGGTPVVWAGPLSSWIAACDLMLGMDVETVVPGHGPVTDKRGVAAVRDYLAYIDAEASARFRAGMGAWDAARDIALGEFASLGERGRIAVNVEAVYRTLDPAHRSPSIHLAPSSRASLGYWRITRARLDRKQLDLQVGWLAVGPRAAAADDAAERRIRAAALIRAVGADSVPPPPSRMGLTELAGSVLAVLAVLAAVGRICWAGSAGRDLLGGIYWACGYEF
jgi:cyclase